MNDTAARPFVGERPAAPLQESILCALAFDAEHGAAIAAQVLVEHFDKPFQPIAERLLDYRRQEKVPPGRAHLDDIFGEQLTGPDAPQYRKLLFALVHLSEQLNSRWVAAQTGAWIDEQRLKGATLAAADVFSSGGRDIAEQVRAIFHEAITVGAPTLDPGLSLLDTKRAFRFLEVEEGITLGIEPFDKAGLVLAPGKLFMYIAAKGRGKTWFAIHCGAQALEAGKKVLHITLEISDTDVAGRYYARCFGIARNDQVIERQGFILNTRNRMDALSPLVYKPELYRTDPHLRRELRTRIKTAPVLGGLLIKEFSANSLTLAQLEHHLDYLEFQQDFIPDMLIIDYPDLMRLDYMRDFRIGLGRLYVGLRGLAARRNLIMITPTQGNRAALTTRRVRSSNVSEDITKVQTADVVMTYSATDDERRRGFGRLLLEHARNIPDQIYVMIVQNYDMGQFIAPITEKDVKNAFVIKQTDAELASKLKLGKDEPVEEAAPVDDDSEGDE